MEIGILALQGAFVEHAKLLKDLGVDSFEIRQLRDLKKPMDGLILPGGESTTMFKLLEDLNMTTTIKKLITSKIPVLGTCAGLLLLAKGVENYPNTFLGTMNIVAKKNAFGRQLGSFKTTGSFHNQDDIPFVFIRAPYIESVGKNVEVLSTHDGYIVAAREDNQLVTAFHPELTQSHAIHSYFIDMISEKQTTRNLQ